MAIVSDDVPEPFGIDTGVNWQVAVLGSPVHESVTAETNPAAGLTWIVAVEEPPGQSSREIKRKPRFENSERYC